jgi:excisionase family DNA binding protein
MNPVSISGLLTRSRGVKGSDPERLEALKPLGAKWHQKEKPVMPLQAIEKISYGIDEAVKASGLGRTFLYERIASGELRSVKVGGRRLILHDDFIAFLKSSAGDHLTKLPQPHH